MNIRHISKEYPKYTNRNSKSYSFHRSRANVQHIDDFANQIIIYFMGSKPNITKRY